MSTLKQDVVNIIIYYDEKAEQFTSLDMAIDMFNNDGSERLMWFHLLEYAMHRENTAQLLNAFTIKSLDILVGSCGAKLIIGDFT
jgi:hypothetical protein